MRNSDLFQWTAFPQLKRFNTKCLCPSFFRQHESKTLNNDPRTSPALFTLGYLLVILCLDYQLFFKKNSPYEIELLLCFIQHFTISHPQDILGYKFPYVQSAWQLVMLAGENESGIPISLKGTRLGEGWYTRLKGKCRR